MRILKRKWPLLLTILFYVFFVVCIHRSGNDLPGSSNHSFHLDLARLVPLMLSGGKAPPIRRVRSNVKLSLVPVNTFVFEFVQKLETGRRCLSDAFVLLIKSAVINFQNRRILRKHFCDSKTHLNYTLVWYFFVGMEAPGQERWNRSLSEETANHSDLIQVNFIDSYMNNTLKLMAEIFWTRDHLCERSSSKQRFIFMDDDVFLNLKRVPLLRSTFFERPALFGHRNVNASPFRWRWSKWYISQQDYSSDTFPPYVSGSTIITNRDALSKICSIIPYVKYFPFDDVFLGIIAELAGLPVVNEKRILVHYKCGLFCYEDPDRSIAVHVPNYLTKLESFYFTNAI